MYTKQIKLEDNSIQPSNSGCLECNVKLEENATINDEAIKLIEDHIPNDSKEHSVKLLWDEGCIKAFIDGIEVDINED